MSDTTKIYAECMVQIRQRIDLACSLVASVRLKKRESFDSTELIFVQFRKSLELIALASLTAHKDQYSAVHANFGMHWKAKAMLNSVEALNPAFYPVGLAAPVRQPNGTRHFELAAGPTLTKDEFVVLYEASSEILHARNPFSPKDPTIHITYSVDDWVARIRNLLTWHSISLINGDVWVVHVPASGPVHVYPSTPTASGTDVSLEIEAPTNDYAVDICTPADLSSDEIGECIALVNRGGAIQNHATIKRRLPRSHALAIVRSGGRIIAVGAIKNNEPLYADKISSRSRHSFSHDIPELGYVARDPAHRNNAFAPRIVAALVAAHPSSLWAATDREGMKAALLASGFVRRGQEWDGGRGRLSLWFRDHAVDNDSPSSTP